ncbi:MAG: hypothetical protein WA964_15400 [Ilumatobacter sp.]|uniref:Sec-independent protein translocase subunit TatA/TatB n=1 Tax=Ilumatobacter sp. TaxID=1967498 RepID=UPI003C771B66
MFNLQGSEIIFILLIALVVLGPEKLPGAIRRATTLYAELRKLSSGFQDEFKSVLDEPIREMKSTADLMKNAADPKWIADEAEREAELEAAAAKKAKQARDTTSAMEAAGAAHLAQSAVAPDAVTDPIADAFADPVEADSEAGDGPGTDTDQPVPGPGTEDEATDHADDHTESETDGANAPDDSAPRPGLSSVDLEIEPEERSA